jgi:hypothetical protein
VPPGALDRAVQLAGGAQMMCALCKNGHAADFLGTGDTALEPPAKVAGVEL